jgi:dTDP-glucose 4,6-dehydratase
MSRILVTGGAGFLGSHLCERLADADHDVIAIDNLISGQLKNIDPIRDYESFEFTRQDITNEFTVGGPLDCIIHLASLASPIFYSENPIETMRVGAQGTERMLEMATDKDAKFLFSSTSEIYGEPNEHPQSEQYRGNVDPFGPRSCYHESKRYGESLVRAFRDEYGTEIRIARIFNTYGPRMRVDDGRVIPTFLAQALQNKPLTVHGDGMQTRSFCYVSDLIDGLIELLETDVQRPVNIGNPDERTIHELAEKIIEITDSNSSITYEPRPPQDPSVRQPDISLARSKLDWEPEISLEAGLERMLAEFQQEVL